MSWRRKERGWGLSIKAGLFLLIIGLVGFMSAGGEDAWAGRVEQGASEGYAEHYDGHVSGFRGIWPSPVTWVLLGAGSLISGGLQRRRAAVVVD